METLTDLWLSGRLIDGILALVILEAIVLLAYKRSRRQASILWSVIPGVCLLMALRTTATEGSLHVILMWITLALPFHLYDLSRRLK